MKLRVIRGEGTSTPTRRMSLREMATSARFPAMRQLARVLMHVEAEMYGEGTEAYERIVGSAWSAPRRPGLALVPPADAEDAKREE